MENNLCSNPPLSLYAELILQKVDPHLFPMHNKALLLVSAQLRIKAASGISRYKSIEFVSINKAELLYLFTFGFTEQLILSHGHP